VIRQFGRNSPGMTRIYLSKEYCSAQQKRIGSNSFIGMVRFPFLAESSGISPERSSPHTDYNIVSPGFFETIGVPVVLGRASRQPIVKARRRWRS
jgi:hypothetical protein